MNICPTQFLEKLTLPNLLTGFRFIAAPFLLGLAWNGHGVAFLSLLAVSFLTDVLDGFAARLTGQTSCFGARLDSGADLITYLCFAFGSWWLWRDIVHREDIYVYIITACYLLPVAVGVVKFNSYAIYHTRTAKLAAVCIIPAAYCLFLGGPAWPFRVAVFIYVAAAIEEIVITLLLPKPQLDVRSLFEVLQHRNKHLNR